MSPPSTISKLWQVKHVVFFEYGRLGPITALVHQLRSSASRRSGHSSKRPRKDGSQVRSGRSDVVLLCSKTNIEIQQSVYLIMILDGS